MCQRICKTSLILMISLFLVGCSNDITNDNYSSEEEVLDASSKERESDYLTTLNDIESNSFTNEISLGTFSGYIHYVEEDKLLLLGDRAMIFDCSNQEIIIEAETDALDFSFYDFRECDVLTYEDGYFVIGNLYNAEDSTRQLLFIEFNKDLEIKKVINVADHMGLELETMAYKLFDDGQKLIYSTMNGLYLYDFVKNEVKDISSDGILFSDFNYLKKEEQIIFTGEQNNGNITYDRVFGKIGVNDLKVILENETEHHWGSIYAFEDFALIEEADVYGKENEGMVFYYEGNGEIQAYPLVDNEENFHIHPSRKGRYYATRTRLDDEGYVIRLYSSDKGELVIEIPLMHKECGENFRILNIFICEKTDKIIFFARGWNSDRETSWLIPMEI